MESYNSRVIRCSLRRRKARNICDSPKNIRKGLNYCRRPIRGQHYRLISFQIVLAHLILYNPATALTKISILLLYRRIFPQPRLLIILRVVGAFVLCYCTTQFFVLLVQCRPVRAAWDPTVADPTCIRVNAAYIVIGTFNAVVDIVILCIPIPLLWRLQISIQKKAQLISIFLLGGL